MTNFITAWPTNRNGLNEAPLNSNNKTNPAKTEITIIGSKKAPPLKISLGTDYVQVRLIRPLKKKYSSIFCLSRIKFISLM